MSNNAAESALVMPSHFDEVLGVDPSQKEEVDEMGTISKKTRIYADEIIQAFSEYEGEDLPEQIKLLLERITSEVRLMGLDGIKALYDFADDDEERKYFEKAAEELKSKLDFFSYLITQLRQLIVNNFNDADEDKRHAKPKFVEAINAIQQSINDYNAKIDDFNSMVAQNSRQ